MTAAFNFFFFGLTSDSSLLDSTVSHFGFDLTVFFTTVRSLAGDAAAARFRSVFFGSYQYLPFHRWPGGGSHVPVTAL
ncbi:hypothetical protein PF010_g12470 [Phytophthora fragariae]|uniref:Uncharacterized protein n=1 Tax=Phytophthora fragariae TaxID=53985 RepID=A0A6G0L2X3_9STRA|nr:hypothetical protein PF010_g12470 [Phytophthora fragariae]